MKPLVIYHDHCTDGFGAAFAAWLKLGDDAEYLPMAYNQPHAFNYNNRDLYILDFSLPREQMESLFTHAKRVVWLDHHKTAFEMWCGKAPNVFFTIHKESDERKHIVLDDCKSGALLAWKYFHPDTEVPMLIKHIDDRDRWQWKMEGSKELHAALASMKPWSFKQWRDLFMVEDQHGDGPFFIYEKCKVLRISGAAILRAQDAHVQSMLKQARKCRIEYNVKMVPSNDQPEPIKFFEFRDGLAVNATLHISEVGHELANQSGTYGLVWYMAADNKVKLSFRSNAPYDVSALAKALGGGGHAQAAGAECTIEELMSWLR